MATMAVNIQKDGSIKDLAGTVSDNLLVSHNSTGQYLVTGVIGIASKGWQTSIPTDYNGEQMIKVAFSGLEDGVIVSVTDKSGQPLDIPDSRVLTLRFDVDDQEAAKKSTA